MMRVVECTESASLPETGVTRAEYPSGCQRGREVHSEPSRAGLRADGESYRTRLAPACGRTRRALPDCEAAPRRRGSGDSRPPPGLAAEPPASSAGAFARGARAGAQGQALPVERRSAHATCPSRTGRRCRRLRRISGRSSRPVRRPARALSGSIRAPSGAAVRSSSHWWPLPSAGAARSSSSPVARVSPANWRNSTSAGSCRASSNTGGCLAKCLLSRSSYSSLRLSARCSFRSSWTRCWFIVA